MGSGVRPPARPSHGRPARPARPPAPAATHVRRLMACRPGARLGAQVQRRPTANPHILQLHEGFGGGECGGGYGRSVMPPPLAVAPTLLHTAGRHVARAHASTRTWMAAPCKARKGDGWPCVGVAFVRFHWLLLRTVALMTPPVAAATAAVVTTGNAASHHACRPPSRHHACSDTLHCAGLTARPAHIRAGVAAWARGSVVRVRWREVPTASSRHHGSAKSLPPG